MENPYAVQELPAQQQQADSVVKGIAVRGKQALAGGMLGVGVLMAWQANAPSLRVVDYEDGCFLIEGCCDEFLRELSAELGSDYGAAPDDLAIRSDS